MTALLPSLAESSVAIPAWVTNRDDVRGFDLRQGREVYGSHHHYRTLTDIVVTNGLVRFRPGPRLGPPYVVVQAWAEGAWRDVGCLNLAPQTSARRCMGARVTRMTRESATLQVDVEGQGPVLLRLRRGERIIRVSHGSTLSQVITTRFVGWSGGPPAAVLSGATVGGGLPVFGTGMRLAASGVARFNWPANVSPLAWTVPLRWAPDAALNSQPDSGIASIQDASGADVATLTWQASTKTLRWVQNGVTLATAALASASIVPVFIGLGFDHDVGRLLSAKVGTSAMVSASDATVAPGATAYAFLSLGQVGVVATGVGWGGGGWGTVGWGGETSTSGGALAGGLIDNPMVFVDRLTAGEVATLAGASTALGGLPLPESRLAWHDGFDAVPVPAGTALSGGVTYEATSRHGLTKGLFVRKAAVTKGSDLSVSVGSLVFEVGAFLSSTTANDTTTAVGVQYHAESHQELRVR